MANIEVGCVFGVRPVRAARQLKEKTVRNATKNVNVSGNLVSEMILFESTLDANEFRFLFLKPRLAVSIFISKSTHLSNLNDN